PRRKSAYKHCGHHQKEGDPACTLVTPRHFGFMTNARRSLSLELCRKLLRMAPVISSTDPTVAPSGWFCPNCPGPMTVIQRFTATEEWKWKSVSKCLLDTS